MIIMKTTYEICAVVRRLDNNEYEVDDSGQEVDAIFKHLVSFPSYDQASRFLNDLEKVANKRYAQLKREGKDAIHERKFKDS